MDPSKLGLLSLERILPPSPEARGATILEACKNDSRDWRRCYMNQFYILTEKSDFETSLRILDSIQETDPRLRDCHLMAHGISRAEVSKNPKNWERIFSKIDQNFCTGGFIHGIIEELSVRDPDFKLNEKTISKICQTIKEGVGRGGDLYCGHISGHILLVEKYADIEQAVKVCDSVPENIRYQCYGGIFMENITRDNLVEHGIADKIPITKEAISAQEDLCFENIGLAATGCWREISHMYTVVERRDPLKVYGLCSRAPVENDKNECYLHAAGLMVRDPNLSEKVFPFLCTPYTKNDEMFKRCSSEMVGTLLHASAKYTDLAERFCLAIPKKYEEFCRQKIKATIKGGGPRDD